MTTGDILGEADFDISTYGANEYKEHSLKLTNCIDPSGFLTVALKGTFKVKKAETKADEPEPPVDPIE